MRIELPSGGWIELRDRLMAQDKMAVQAAIRVVYEPAPGDDSREVRRVDGGTDDRMRVALLSRIITAWSFAGVPVPASNIADPEDLIGSTLDLDDYEAVCEAVQPLFLRVVRGKAAAEGKAAETAPAAAEGTP